MGRTPAFYNSAEWKALRQAVLARDPICKHCGKDPSVVADHIVPRNRGGPDTLDNLQGLCKSCDGRKTSTEDGGYGNPVNPGSRWLTQRDLTWLTARRLSVDYLKRALAEGLRFAAETSTLRSAGKRCDKMRTILVCLRPGGRRAAFWPNAEGRKRPTATLATFTVPKRTDREHPAARKYQQKAEQLAARLNALAPLPAHVPATTPTNQPPISHQGLV
jgi:hypothetical protein